jgi:regulatory protein
MARPPRKPPPDPTEASLHEAALTYLSRYAATRAGLVRVLDRRIARWLASDAGDADKAQIARDAARRVAAKLAETGAVNDAAFAQARTRTLQRAGKSARAISAHLAAKGVSSELGAARPPPDDLGAAAIHLRRRRLGPYRSVEDSQEQRRRELAAMARAGFPHAIASAALRLSRAEAEALIIQFRERLD